ncbi:beta-1 adrenergic receptor-like [Symsagittifera roscoffensis]|uniref:beta-1 adrenergic receptor-like n=1 Tax=Symsagittifera roscoffensis TaxID=84072 RepID=UPI00307B178D
MFLSNVSDREDYDEAFITSSEAAKVVGDDWVLWVRIIVILCVCLGPLSIICDVIGFVIGRKLPVDTPTPVILQYLSVADSVFILQLTATSAAYLGIIPRLRVANVAACKIFSFCNWFAHIAMQLSYSALSLDRVLALYLPFTYHTWTRRQAVVPLITVTAISAVASVIPILGYGIMHSSNEEAYDGNGDTFCKAMLSAESYVDIVSYVVNMTIPVALVVVFNCMIVVALVRKPKVQSSGRE